MNKIEAIKNIDSRLYGMYRKGQYKVTTIGIKRMIKSLMTLNFISYDDISNAMVTLGFSLTDEVDIEILRAIKNKKS